MSREENVYMAKLAEQAERYEGKAGHTFAFLLIFCIRFASHFVQTW